MVLIQVVPDRFKERENAILAATAQSIALTGHTQQAHVRRPTNGIQLKEPTYSTLRVEAGNGNRVVLVDAGSRSRSGRDLKTEDGKSGNDLYSNFLLQSVQVVKTEKSQILETFGEAFIFFFGERARIYQFSGVLVNTFDFNWAAEWEANYDRYIRGTKCVENDARVFLSFDETIVSGYILDSNMVFNAEAPSHVPFSFQMFVTSSASISALGDPSALPESLKNNRVTSNSDASRFLPKPFSGRKVPGTKTFLDKDGNTVTVEAEPGTLSQAWFDTKAKALLDKWSDFHQAVNSTLKTISGLSTGSTVRVPQGFEGAFAFDVNDDVQLRQVEFGLVKYTVFSDNVAEYVGLSTHYGSVIRDEGLVNVRLDSTPDDAARARQVTRAAWEKFGYSPPDSYQNSISDLLLNKAAQAGTNLGLGLLGAGASTLWKKFKTPPDSVPSFKGFGPVADPNPQEFAAKSKTLGRMGSIGGGS